ncbi:MAG TPA: amidohydrolase family protein [Chitinophagaceae bacterium]|nr:amidohydrolase family protein [Chitinophagaceae bacterium]
MRHSKWMLLFFLPLFCSAQVKIFYNARIFTAEVNHPFAEAIAISSKKIIAIGNFSDVKKVAGPSALAVDCKGNFLMPGFIDSHCHAIEGGNELTKANTGDKLLTTDELVSYAKNILQSKEKMTGDVLVISGINISAWSHLDEIIDQFNGAVFAEQPVVLCGSDGHTCWANNAMMKRAGLIQQFIQSLKPADKIFYGITKDGMPNGFANESGQEIIRAAIPAGKDYHRAAEKTMEYCGRLGITALLDPSAGSTDSKQQDYLDAYTWLINNGKLTTHIAATIVSNANAEPQKQIDIVKAMQKKIQP